MVEAVAAVAAVAAGDVVIGAPQGPVRGRGLLQLPLQDAAHRAAPLTGRTCTEGEAHGSQVRKNDSMDVYISAASSAPK